MQQLRYPYLSGPEAWQPHAERLDAYPEKLNGLALRTG
jgi:hypothetical protein